MRKFGPILMAISVLLVACACSEKRTRGMIVANTGAIREARKIQSLLARTQKCPAALVGWTLPTEQYRPDLEKWLGTEEQQFPASLICGKDLKFSISLKYDIDSGTWVSGSETGPLEIAYGHFTALKTLEISSSDDPETVAAKVVREQ